MRKIETDLPGVILIEPQVFQDARGFFLESYHAEKFAALGITNSFIQDNHSQSVKGTLRGLHYQLNFPQAKLCRVTRGEVLDVAVDIRRNSPHFGKWTGVVLSAENKLQIYVPPGFAHGFLVLSEEAEFLYKCDQFYNPPDERCLRWDDPQIGIDWQLEKYGIDKAIFSEKDGRAPTLQTIDQQDLPLLRISI
jgi:dTDP-4-dehydrorhamnose 3,5-epimerase